MYINSTNFDAADTLFASFIKPHISNFEKLDVEFLISGIGENNQTHWRGGAKSDHKLIVDRALEIVDGFDVKEYAYLPQA